MLRQEEGEAGRGQFTECSAHTMFHDRLLHVRFHSGHWEYEGEQNTQIPTLVELTSWWKRKIIGKLNKIGTMLDIHDFKEGKTK